MAFLNVRAGSQVGRHLCLRGQRRTTVGATFSVGN